LPHSTALGILIVEDSAEDFELVLRELKGGLGPIRYRQVQTAEELKTALGQERWDVVISDNAMPFFSGSEALKLVRELAPETPFILVSGSIGEEAAVEKLRAGANDYLMKGSLKRLPAAVNQQLREAETRSARRQAEEALRRAELKYRSIFENAAVGICKTSLEGKMLDANPAMLRMLGYDAAARVANVAREVYADPEDRDRLMARLKADRVVRDFEVRLLRTDGRTIWVSQSVSILRDEADSAPYLLTIAEDITQRRRLEAESQRFRLALDNSADMILIIDRASMRYVDVNQTACRLLGYSREELLAMGPEEILPVARQEIERAYDALIADPSAASGMTSRYRCKDGTPLPFESTRHVLRAGDSWLIAAVSRDIRPRLAAERALQEHQAALQRAQTVAKLAHVVTGDDGVFESWSETLPQLIGVERDRLPRSTREWLEWLHAEDRAAFRTAAIEAGATGERRTVQYRLRRADGEWIHVRQVIEPLPRGPNLADVHWFSTIQDVTEQRRAEQRIERLNRVHAVLSSINSLIVRTKDRAELFKEACHIAVNQGGLRAAWIGVTEPATGRIAPVASSGPLGDLMQRLEPLLGQHADSPVGAAVRIKAPFVSNEAQNDPRVHLAEEHKRLGTRALAVLPLLVQGEVRGVLTLHATEAGFFDADEMKLLLELAGDISFAIDHIEKVEKIDYLAYYDALTGLPNRTLFQEHLTQSVRAAEAEKQRLALVLVDLERFRSINEGLGRPAGDALLRQVTERLKRAEGDSTNLGALGADHFGVVLSRLRGDEHLARRLDRRLHQLFDEPFRLGEAEIRVSAKLGISVFPEDASSAESLFKNAEAALKKAKAGDERYAFYTQGTTERVAEKLLLENRMHQALEKDEFVLFYQPKVALETRKIVGAEALIRWQSPERGLVPPLQFIPLLEETGLILQVGTWALQRAARDHCRWVERGLPAPRIAVNVSQLQLRQRDFVGVVERAIVDGTMPPGVDLEITESMMMEDVKANIEKLKAVRALGLRIAIDDFGTGYSSLGYLAQLPVESLKIDRSFIVAMTGDPNAMSLVSTIISLAHSLRLKVVAEGVETEDQAKFLRLLRCDEMQGYLIGKPVPEPELVKLLGG
jgi:diguanylate cyclase (GGDEF)-like protein/PAS domain S-box-containing protein